MKPHNRRTCPSCKADDLLFKRALKALLAFSRARTKRKAKLKKVTLKRKRLLRKKKRRSNTGYTQAALQRIDLRLRKAEAHKALDPINAPKRPDLFDF